MHDGWRLTSGEVTAHGSPSSTGRMPRRDFPFDACAHARGRTQQSRRAASFLVMSPSRQSTALPARPRRHCAARTPLPSSHSVRRKTDPSRAMHARLVHVGLLVIALAGCEPQTIRLLPERDAGAGSAAAKGQSAGTSCTETSAECGRYLSHCDVSVGRCVQCLSPSHCDGPETCDPATQRCLVPCSRDDDCGSSQSPSTHCSPARGFCVECDDDTSCTGRHARYCDRAAGECVECLSDANCTGDLRFCDPDLHYCKACPHGDNCPDAASCSNGGRSCTTSGR